MKKQKHKIEDDKKGRGAKNAKLLASFSKYCLKHPEFRFWQALRNWSGNNLIYVADDAIDWKPLQKVGKYRWQATVELIKGHDTFYSDKRNGK